MPAKSSARNPRRRKSGSGKRSASSSRWLARQRRDQYVRGAKAKGYRSRAAWKLLDMAQAHDVFAKARAVLDLGAAPGSWCQVARALAPPDCTILGIDLAPVAPLDGVEFWQGDVCAPGLQARLAQRCSQKLSVLLSDMAPAHSGLGAQDHLRQLALAQAALTLGQQHLAPGGHMCLKLLQGQELKGFLAGLRPQFATSRLIKPPASRAQSAELYVLGLGYTGKTGAHAHLRAHLRAHL